MPTMVRQQSTSIGMETFSDFLNFKFNFVFYGLINAQLRCIRIICGLKIEVLASHNLKVCNFNSTIPIHIPKFPFYKAFSSFI